MQLPFVTDRAGRIVPLRVATLGLLCLPALWIGFEWAFGLLAPRLYNDINHQLGLWAIRIFLVSMACTPVRTIFGYAKILQVRRMIGVASLIYLLAHFLFYVIDLGWNIPKVASEIVLRWYLTVGFAGLLIMIALGVTSFDSMIKRLGIERWKHLHSLVHVVAGLGLLHFFMQSKLDVSEASITMGLWILLEGIRFITRFRVQRSVLWLGLNGIAAAVLTAGLQAGWYGIATRIKYDRVLWANLNFHMISPAWYVLAVGLGLAVAYGLAQRFSLIPQERVRAPRARS